MVRQAVIAAFADEFIKISAVSRGGRVLEFLQMPFTKADALNTRTYFPSQYAAHTEKLRKGMTPKGYAAVRDFAETKPMASRRSKTKTALAAPPLSKALNTPFSSSTLKRQTFKSFKPTVGKPAAGRVATGTQAAGAVAPAPGNILGVNLRKHTTVDPKMPLVKGTPPASPVHVAPQVNPQAASIRQGAPQTVNSAAPTAGGAGVSAPAAPTAGGSGGASGARR